MPLFNTDFDGVVRPQGSAWDIGAYEYGGSAPGDTTPPTVNIISPTNGATVSGSTVVTATASDNVGVVGVQFKLDGANLGTEDTSSPYSINWNTATISNGSHTLTAVARDAAGLTSTSSSISVSVNNVVVPSPPTTVTLIAAYAFNEGSGSTSVDISGKNHVATLSSTTWNNTGKYGNSLNFNGINSYASIADANDLDFTTGITLEAWIYPTGTTSGAVIVKNTGSGSVYRLYASHSSYSNTPLFAIVSGGNTKQVTGPSSLPLNVWSYLAGTYDGSVMRLYVNGFEVSNIPASGAIDASSGELWVGGNQTYGEYFSGKIDDIRIYSGALNQSAIQTDMNTPLSGIIPPTDTGLKIAYALGEGSGGTTSDSSGNTHTGTLVGPTWVSTGKYGNALLFDGVNDYVSTPDVGDLDFTNGMTLEMWVYPSTTPVGPTYWTGIAKAYVYYLYPTHGDHSNYPIIGFENNGQETQLPGTSVLPAATWSYLVGTYDGSTLRLYVNGSQVSSMSGPGNIDTNNAAIWLGGNESYGEYFPGIIDNVRIYNRALSVSEIQTNMSLAITSGQDLTPPTISSVTSSNLTSSSARITWTTNEASDSQVEYGLTTTYGTTTTLNSSQVTSHTVDLVGLSSSSTYHYRVKSKDASNNLSMSSDATFATSAPADVTAPVISGVGTSSLSTTSVNINWTTNEAADSQVEFGPTTAYENGSTTLNTSLVTSHTVSLSGLTASTVYHYRVKSRDGSGNLATGSDNNFTTSALPDTTAPIITSILNSTPTTSSTTVTWTTNEASTSVVEYGITTSYGSTASDSTLVTAHSVDLSGLSSGTLYHYRVKSADAASNLATSSDGTFTTQVTPDTTPPIISNLQPSGTLAAGTTQVTLSCTTNELATLKYGTTPGTTYDLMPGTFSTTGGTTHSVIVMGLVNGTTYTYYIKGRDVAGNTNTGDLYTIIFSIASTPPPPPPATITVTTPNGGQNWTRGTTKQIRWSSSGVTTNVKIELYNNGRYTTIFSNLTNSGSANWVVSGVRDRHCLIRVSTVDGTVSDSSNTYFRIS